MYSVKDLRRVHPAQKKNNSRNSIRIFVLPEYSPAFKGPELQSSQVF